MNGEIIDVELSRKKLLRMFQLFENIWLKNDLFIGGLPAPSIADLSAFCEIIQLELINFDFTPHKKIHLWMNKMFSIPEIQETHKIFYKIKAAE